MNISVACVVILHFKNIRNARCSKTFSSQTWSIRIPRWLTDLQASSPARPCLILCVGTFIFFGLCLLRDTSVAPDSWFRGIFAVSREIKKLLTGVWRKRGETSRFLGFFSYWRCVETEMELLYVCVCVKSGRNLNNLNPPYRTVYIVHIFPDV